MYVRVQARVGMSFLLCMQTKILHIHIMFPPPPCGWVGGGSYHLQPCIGITICLYWFMYENFFVCIDLWFVCMYVCTCARKVGISFLLCMQTKKLHIHIMFPAPPPVGGVGGVLPSAAMYRYNYMFVLIYVWELFVLYWFMVCLYVCMYMCTQGRYIIFYCVCKQKITTYTHNVPAPPPVGGLGGSYHLQPCIGITICFSIDLCMISICFVLIYGLFVCMYIRVQARSGMSIFYCVRSST